MFFRKKSGNLVKGKTPWYCAPIEKQREFVRKKAPRDLRHWAEQFVEEGVVVVEHSVSEEMIDEALAGFGKLVTDNKEAFSSAADAQGNYARLINLHLVLPQMQRLYFENKALRLLEFLFQARPALYTSLYFQRGSTQPLHRDTPFFTTNPRQYYVGFWVALEDATTRNGTLQVVRGGHLLPELDLNALARTKYENGQGVAAFDMDMWKSYQAGMMESVATAGLKPEALPIKAGSTVLWHPHLPHGGTPIEDQGKTRNSLVVHTTPKGVPVGHQDAFYGQDEDRPIEASWSYRNMGPAEMVEHGQIDIGHNTTILLENVVV